MKYKARIDQLVPAYTKPKRIKGKYVKPKVENMADICNLGWVGNFSSDVLRFKAVNDFIKKMKGPKLLAARQVANWLANAYGMGEMPKLDPTYDPLDDMQG